MLLGASAALHGVARAEDRRVRVDLSLREAALIVGGIGALLVGVYVGVCLRQ